jgi:hypothetical protein
LHERKSWKKILSGFENHCPELNNASMTAQVHSLDLNLAGKVSLAEKKKIPQAQRPLTIGLLKYW